MQREVKLVGIGLRADRIIRDIVSRDREFADLRAFAVSHVETALAFAVVCVITHSPVEAVRGFAEDNGIVPDAPYNVSLAAKSGHIRAEGVGVICDPEKNIPIRRIRSEAVGEPLGGFLRR